MCPFCGKLCSVVETVRPSTTEPEPALIHQTPPCERFETLEIDDFLHEVNVRFGAYN